MTAHPGVVERQCVGSTMDEAHTLAATGAPDGTAVWAREQTAARGSRGRAWVAPEGGLWLSVIRRPPRPGAAAGLEVLSLRVGLAVAEALDRVPAVPALALKWPNDLMLDDQKVGGILCESRWQGAALGWVVIGLGLNVRNAVPPDLVPRATSLLARWPEAEPELVLPGILSALRSVGLEAPELDAAEQARWQQRDWLAGRQLVEPVPGRALGIAADGALRIGGPQGGTAEARSGPVVLMAERR